MPLLLWTGQAWLRPDAKRSLPERTQVDEMSDPGTRIFIAMPSPARLAAPKTELAVHRRRACRAGPPCARVPRQKSCFATATHMPMQLGGKGITICALSDFLIFG